MVRDETDEIRRVVVMLTNRCNLRCGSCRIWQEGKQKSITLESGLVLNFLREALTFASVGSFGITGGEPFIVPKQLRRILQGVTEFLKDRRIGVFSITTNGSYPLRVRRFVECLTPVQRNAVFFNVSLDGLEKTHNRLRGLPVFRKTLKTLQVLRANHINTAINYTILPDNVADIFFVYKIAGALGVSIEYEFFTPHNPAYYHYFSMRKTSPASVGSAWKREAKQQFQKILDDGSRYCNKELIEVLLASLSSAKVEASLSKKCRVSRHSYFIRATGEVYGCPYEAPLGKIRASSIKEMQSSRKVLVSQIKSRGCHRCLSTMGSLAGLSL